VPCPPACLVHKWMTGRRTGAASEQVCAQAQRTASANESLNCRGSSAHVATSSSGSTAAGGVLLGHEAPKQFSCSLCMAGRHRMRVRLRLRASSLRFLSWKTRRRLALRRCLEFGDVEGASAPGSSAWAGQCARVAQTAEPEEGPLPASAESAQPAQSASQHRGRARWSCRPRAPQARPRVSRGAVRGAGHAPLPCRRAARPTAPAWQRQRRRHPWQKRNESHTHTRAHVHVGSRSREPGGGGTWLCVT